MNATHPDLLAPGFKPEPFWWERSPRPSIQPGELPPEVDVAVIGSGYTGLNAAIATARGGRDTVVLDAEAAGFGCSTRNGGQISTSIKPDYDSLARQFGAERAFAIRREGHDALAWIGNFIAEEQIDCDFRICGRFYAAHSPRQYEALTRTLDGERPGLETDAYAVPRAEQHTEIDSDLYHGGIVQPHHAALDPGRYHQGLLERATAAGTRVFPGCEVTAIEGSPGQLILSTTLGRLRARNVVVATNGYTGRLTPWRHRRVIPIGSSNTPSLRTSPLSV